MKAHDAGHDEEIYETEVLPSAALESGLMELTKSFFRSLDTQFNIVNRFYKQQEEEYSQEAQSLHLEMEALVKIRIELDPSSNFSDICQQQGKDSRQ